MIGASPRFASARQTQTGTLENRRISHFFRVLKSPIGPRSGPTSPVLSRAPRTQQHRHERPRRPFHAFNSPDPTSIPPHHTPSWSDLILLRPLGQLEKFWRRPGLPRRSPRKCWSACKTVITPEEADPSSASATPDPNASFKPERARNTTDESAHGIHC